MTDTEAVDRAMRAYSKAHAAMRVLDNMHAPVHIRPAKAQQLLADSGHAVPMLIASAAVALRKVRDLL